MNKTTNTWKPVLAALTAGMCCVAGLVVAPAQPASADTYSNLVNAQNQHAASAQREAQLKAQLAGVNSELANKIVELDDLTNNKIVAAQNKVTQANADAAAAQDEADAAAKRLEAAQKDKETLEQQIAQTGKDYDDAHAAVAELARESMHGSSASEVMSVVTGASSTQDFVNSMQSRDALSRNEANAASSAASELNTSKNRGERLAAIEKQISTLKTQADQKAASAQTAAETAQNERNALEQLRVEGEQRRNELTAMVSSLKDQQAAQAAQTVLLASRVDSYNQQYLKEQQQSSGQVNNGQQGTTQPGGGGSSTVPPTTGGGSGGSSGGQGTSNGDYGNAYYGGQCTWYAYNRRKQMGIGTPSYLGNGGQWYLTAPGYGLRVDHNPQVGAALSFPPGVAGADGTYGHVAVVESVSGNTVTISEMNVVGEYVVSWRTLSNAGAYWYVH
ncbi:CHAP domain-containing protein [Bifidobacterium reuteri]|uniref:CHAP domain protein n=2 Tax=Bifidobacterium reuteri TaxID=983706 RepID=A0A087CXH2_9BIFI|nr:MULTISPECIES: CHAP domain-containing protein [Bifidobacterium]KAA8825232.1 CHAP domain-containing protein [Bifidobacterium reuteri]KFI87972.1 CHAP domain protein [Bifidobacterium reuteri DSM 23975]TPF78617.1 amidase [Bifidobacterium sp. UTCIF-1]TPF80898.1 amidase [Bifidobacterium sp. UTCIF-24]TPF82662.1 amidase [Bifidobacterium sp. UTCIF-3]